MELNKRIKSNILYTEDIYTLEWPVLRIGTKNLYVRCSLGIALQTNKNALFGGMFKKGTLEVSAYLGIGSYACFSLSFGVTWSKVYIKVGLLFALPKQYAGVCAGAYIEISVPTWVVGVAAVAVAAASAYCPPVGAFVGKTIAVYKSSQKAAASVLVAIFPSIIYALV